MAGDADRGGESMAVLGGVKWIRTSTPRRDVDTADQVLFGYVSGWPAP
jgi:hypothetical protein